MILLREEMGGGSLAEMMALKASPLDMEVKIRILSDVAKGLSYLKALSSSGLKASGQRWIPSALGRLLSRPLRWLRSLLGGRSASQASSWWTQLGSAAGYTLDRTGCSMVHGRLTPSNVFLDRKLNAKLGIDLAQPLLTARELAVYSAPEVLRGEGPTAASDVFSFGVLLFELMTGLEVYSDLTLEEAIKGVQHGVLRPRLPASLYPGLGDLVYLCLANEPQHRPQIDHIQVELERFVFRSEVEKAMSSISPV